jgi:high-affinity nickel-transport protein
MSVSLSAVSLLVGGLGIGKLASPALDQWSEGKELACGLGVTLTVAISYLAARWLCRETAAQRYRILRH